MSKIVITGSTGKLGKLIINHLLEIDSADQLIASARNVDKAKNLFKKNIEIRYGNYDNPSSLEESFKGADKLLLISSTGGTALSRIHQHINVIEAAKHVGIKHIFYTSFAAVDKGSFPLLGNVHLATEYAIRSSGIPFTIFRNAFYQDSYVNDSLLEIVNNQSIITSAGKGKINTVGRNDLALAISTVLGAREQPKSIYELASNEAWNYDELASILTSVTGKKVTHNSLSESETIKYLIQSGQPEPTAQFQTLRFKSMSEDKEGNTSTDLENILGRKPVSLKNSIQAYFKDR